jgi:hypothetical protein
VATVLTFGENDAPVFGADDAFAFGARDIPAFGADDAPAFPDGEPADLPAAVRAGVAGDAVPVAPAASQEDSWAALGRKVIENAPTMFKQAAGGALQAIAETPPSPPPGIEPTDPMWQGVVSAHRERIGKGGPDETGRKIYEEATADLKANAPKVDPESLKGYAYDIAQGIVQMGPAITAAIAARSPAPAVGIIATQVGGHRYGESRAEGRTPEQAATDAVFYAAAEAIPESVPLGILMKPGGKFLSRVLKVGGAEGVQEMFTEALQTGYDAGALGEEMTWGEAVDQIRRAGIVGVGVGGGIAVVTQPFDRGAQPTEPPPDAQEGPTAPAPGTAPVREDMAAAETDFGQDDSPAFPEGAVPAETVIGQEAEPGQDVGGYVEGEKYSGHVSDVTALDPKTLRVRDAGEVREVSDEVARNMDFSEPVEITLFADGTRIINDGHHRVAAAKRLGMKSIPVRLIGVNARAPAINAAVDESRALSAEQPDAPILTDMAEPAEEITPQAPETVAQEPVGAPEEISPALRSPELINRPKSDVAAAPEQASPAQPAETQAVSETARAADTTSPETTHARLAKPVLASTVSLTPDAIAKAHGIETREASRLLQEMAKRGEIRAVSSTTAYDNLVKRRGQIEGSTSIKPAAKKRVLAKIDEQIAQVGGKVRYRRPQKRGPLTLSQFVASKGGIRDEGGELSAMDLGNRTMIPGFGPLVRSKGRQLDYAREAAVEVGYLPEGSTVADFLDAIRRDTSGKDARGKVFSQADESEVAGRIETAESEAEQARESNARAEIAAAVKSIGMVPADETGAVARVMAGEDSLDVVADIWERAALQSESDARDEIEDTARREGEEAPPLGERSAPEREEETRAADAGRTGRQAGRADEEAGRGEGVKPLYANRPVTNAADIVAWAKAQGFKQTLRPEDMHVTVAFSREPVEWEAVGETAKQIGSAPGGARAVEKLGDEGAVVLRFENGQLKKRWQLYRNAGASWDFEGYKPHITITYDAGDLDLSKVEPYNGPIRLGPEQQEDLDTDATSKVDEVPTGAQPVTTEQTPQGEQAVIPGTERSARQAQAAREAEGRGRIRSRTEQKDADEGLFAEKRDDETPLFQRSETAPEPPFFSALTRAVEAMKLPKAPARQWLGSIRNAAGVKAEEIEWSGVAEWLDAQTGAVSKEDLLAFLRENEVRVEEVVKGGAVRPRLTQEELQRLQDFYDYMRNGERLGAADLREFRRLEALQEQDAAEVVETKFASHTLPGGENYRELLLTLPSDSAAAEEARAARIEELQARRDRVLARDGPGRDVTLGNIDMQISMVRRETESRADFRAGHFDEPNVLAHIRFNERTDADGSRVLFIEEIQSDWHQKGRKQGYRDEAAVRRAQQARERANSAARALREAEEAIREFRPSPTMSRIDGANARARLDRERQRLEQEWRQASQDLDEIDRTTDTGGVPDAPFKSSWHEIAFKRALRWAAENGFDRIAWTTGEQQAERYDLSKKVSYLRYKKNPDGTFHLKAKTIEGRDLTLGENIPEAQLPDHIGKDIADKIARGERSNHPGQQWSDLYSPDLKVGGEGMKGFYDRILPRFANKYAKKWGAKVGTVNIAGERPGLWRSGDTREAARQRQSMTEVHALPITPEMRESVTAGQPLFKTEEQVSGAGRVRTRYHFADEFAGRREAVSREIRKLLDGMGLHDVGLRIADRITASVDRGPEWDAEGRYFHGVIDLALAGKDTPRAARHEAIHAMRELGLFTEPEWKLLSQASEKMWREQYGIDSLYEGFPEWVKTEEGIAHAYSDWRAGDLRIGGLIRRAFAKVRKFLEALANALRGQGFQTVDDVFARVEGGEAGTRERRRTGRRGTERFSLTPDTPDSAENRQTAGQGMIARGQPLDRAMRLPFDWFGGVNEKGEWKPGLKLFDKAETAFKTARFPDRAPFGWTNTLLENARRGLIDRYGLDPEYVKRERKLDLDKREIAEKGAEIIQSLAKSNIGAEEAKVLQSVLTGEEIPTGEMAKLSAPIRQAIDDLGAEAVSLGLVSPESYNRNRGTYLHRVYMKHEGDQPALSRWFTSFMTKKRKRIQGDALKGRGMFLEVPIDRAMQDVSEFREGRRGAPVKGEKFTVLDKYADQGTLEIVEPATPKIERRIYWPADKAIPDRYSDFADQGTWEVRATAKGKITLWRDFTKPERTRMGEILDARYTIGKTFMLMAQDLSTGRFYRDIAQNSTWTRTATPNGKWANPTEYRRLWQDDSVEWVKVPDTDIPNTGGKKRWGALAGKFVRAEIWRDLNEADILSKPNLWTQLLTQWKLNKTARSPVVHMNNVMSNMVFMDLADVRLQDLVRGIRAYVNETADFKEAQENGAFGSDIISQEIRRNVLQPILEDLQRQVSAGNPVLAKFGALGKVADAIWRTGKAADRKMVEMYRMEDEIFRMAMYMRRRSLGDNAENAASEALQQFLNYDIKAPWVNAARRTALPFIAYTYRAVPVIARSIATRPWKLAKYFLIAQAASYMAYMMAPGDEDEERRSMREEERGYTWIGVERMQRMPYRDTHGNPVFLDIRRWIPAGDVFDLSQGHGAFSIPAPIQFGGPLMLAAELALNKSAFTGEPITNEMTDTGADKAGKIADWAWKSWMPSAAWIPGSWYWEKIGLALDGATDPKGRPYPVPEAVASSFGVKLKPQDVESNLDWRAYEFDKARRALRAEERRIARQRDRNIVSEEAFREAIDSIETKRRRLQEREEEVFPPTR